MNKPITYVGSGVDYDKLDPFKLACQKRAALTSGNAVRLGLSSVEATRGESFFALYERNRDGAHKYFGCVEEGLGTKNLVADEVAKLTGKSWYRSIAQDTVAMIVNDLVTGGIMPVAICMHIAVASGDWFSDTERSQELVEGWGNACDLSRAVWAGGETPGLKGIIVPGTALLSGGAFGIAKHNKLIRQDRITSGDSIVIIESSGIHANGLTMARKIADKLPEKYQARHRDGRPYGEALLDPTHIYVGLVEDCLDTGVDIHYAVNITGHGWRKFMRATKPFTYVIETLPTQLPIFDFIQENGPVEIAEMYGNYNMGAGFALYVSDKDVEKVLEVATVQGLKAFKAGFITAGEKKVEIRPIGLEFAGGSLAVR